MCVLTFMPDTVTASYEDLWTGAQNNPDGFGFAIHDSTRIITGHGMDFHKVVDEFMRLRKVYNGPALFHSRITTHGTTNKANCHPFQIGNDKLSVIAHNGMLPIPSDGKRSDTRIFAEDILPENGGVSILDSKRMRKKLSKFASGSKLVILTANKAASKDSYIINEKDGHWAKDGVWWSNKSYCYTTPKVYTSIGYGMYSTGWEPVTSKVSSASESFTDWVEEWECQLCCHIETVHEYEVDDKTACPICNTCWYCGDDALWCDCGIHQGIWTPGRVDTTETPYDSTIDVFERF